MRALFQTVHFPTQSIINRFISKHYISLLFNEHYFMFKQMIQMQAKLETVLDNFSLLVLELQIKIIHFFTASQNNTLVINLGTL